MSTLILGLNAFHGDSSACLVEDGKIVAAAEEERCRRVKHWAGFPTEAIRYCLEERGVTLADVGHVAINRDARANFFSKLVFAIKRRPGLATIVDRLRHRVGGSGLQDMFDQHFPDKPFTGQIHSIEHHLSHLASAYYVSPFDEAVVVSVDGLGDFASAAWGLGVRGDLRVDGRVLFPHSLGLFYQALTQYLGFPQYGDEYKVMGLAPYGKPTFFKEVREIVPLKDDGTFRLNLQYFRHHREVIEKEWGGGIPVVANIYAPALCDLLGPARTPDQPLEQRHRDIARSVQQVYEETFFHMLNALYKRYGVANVALAGGCGMNSVANGKVYRSTKFRRLYVQSAAGDAGGAIGCALVAWHRIDSHGTRYHMDHAYLGPHFNDAEIGSLLEAKAAELQAQSCSVRYFDIESELVATTATAITDGLVIGWFQGRMEWGPRALGNRSILADPRRSDMKDILNLKIKRRESFRPFAPSVLREHVSAWFETDDDVPFMMQVYQIKEEKRAAIPAVTHVDGSGRLQTVSNSTNPRYHALIEEFRRKTGVPMLLNTSFNENEPVVCLPREALDCFLRTKMDVLVLGNHLVRRSAA